MKKLIYLSSFLAMTNFSWAQEKPSTDTTDISDLSIEELAKAKSRYNATEMEKETNQSISAASRKPLSLKKSPSIISVVTAEEIEKSGSRDILDVLKLVPGIEFNTDIENSLGISIRGLWANEGKVLLLLDGQELNETAYASLTFGNNFNISQIKKVEVIRGPGSAIYGGFAEYAVINIITHSGEELDGVAVNAVAGQTANAPARQNISASVGQKVKDFQYSVSLFAGQGQRSNRKFTDIYGSTIDMNGNSKLNPVTFNVALGNKNLSFRFIYDALNGTTRDGLYSNLSKSYPITFTQYLAELKHVAKLNKNLQLQTKLNYKFGLPWKTNEEPTDTNDVYVGYTRFCTQTERYRANVTAIWDPTSQINVTAGGEFIYDKASKPNEGDVFRNDSVKKVSYINYAPYAQALFKTRFANITVGARYDVSNLFGSAFNPRLGITKKVGVVNFKLLYASSYRAPVVENIQTSFAKSIKPEQTQTYEMEMGVEINKNLYTTLSLYDITTQNCILYYVSGATDGYKNVGKSGSQGLDLEIKYKSVFGFINANYSYYTVANKTRSESSEVTPNRNTSLGIANHKFNILASINVGKYIYVSPSVNFLGNRYAYSTVDSLGNGVLEKFKPNTQINLFIGAQNLVKGLKFGLGVYNLSDEKILYLQAYNSLHAPYPGMGREFVIKASYTIGFKAKEEKK